MHISSSWYGGRKIYRDEPWAWQKPYGWVIMHSPILLGLYNADPTARHLVTGLVDGLLAHGKQGADGLWLSQRHQLEQRCRARRRWRRGQPADAIGLGGLALYRHDKYLRPVLGRLVPGSSARWAN
jgi:hypothetical protein